MTDEYLIRKNGYWYRPNANGYTSSQAEAGRFTLEEAIRYSHPNGPNGPRDGITYEPAPPRLTAQSGEGRSGAGEDAIAAVRPTSGEEMRLRARLTASPMIEALTPTNEEWVACETVQDTYDLMKRRIRAALNARQSGEGGREAIDCEQLARAMNPPLWSDDEETAHRAASPLQVCCARERAVEEAKVVLIELTALRATDEGSK